MVLLIVLAPGCNRAAHQRLPVRGSVARADREKFSGSITFLPAKGTLGPAATTSLVDGEYRFDRHNGPVAGPHQVVVSKVIPKGEILRSLPKGVSTADGKTAGRVKTASTAEEKTEWTLSAEVPAEPPYQCDFTLAP
jgi:hypothetical protein